jgi:hypothetical protein
MHLWNISLPLHGVNFLEHYQAFAAALPHHTSLINHLGATQSQLNDARLSLQEAKDALGSKRADLVQLWSRGQTLEEMMRILDQMCVYTCHLVLTSLSRVLFISQRTPEVCSRCTGNTNLGKTIAPSLHSSCTKLEDDKRARYGRDWRCF